MNEEKLIPFEEVAHIFCMEPDELKRFLNTRNFNLELEKVNGIEVFSLEDVQEHLQSQYFI